MYTVGCMIPTKEQEKRRALRPEDIAGMRYGDQIYLPFGYGEVCGYDDEEYRHAGAHIVSFSELLKKDIICDPKIGDAAYLPQLAEGAIVFGWVHAAETRDRCQQLIDKRFTAYAWENMYKDGQHIFYKNNELAGKAAVLHAFQQYGALPQGMRVAILGNGNTAHGAMHILHQLGANVDVYPRKAEPAFRAHLPIYDAIVNCILWDVDREDHILYRSDLSALKPQALLIDVACDAHCAIETIHPTTISEPMYQVDGIWHYAVDHTPSLYPRTFMKETAPIIAYYLDQLIEDAPDAVLRQAMIAKDGNILDPNILTYLQMQKNKEMTS